MRQRLFWALVVLDLRSAEDQGTECHLHRRRFRYAVPAQHQRRRHRARLGRVPEPRQGRRASPSPSRGSRSAPSRASAPGVAGRRAARWAAPRCCGPCRSARRAARGARPPAGQVPARRLGAQAPMKWVAGNVTRIIIAKMVTVIYQPLLFSPAADRTGRRTADRLRARLFTGRRPRSSSSLPRPQHGPARPAGARWLFQTLHAVARRRLPAARAVPRRVDPRPRSAPGPRSAPTSRAARSRGSDRIAEQAAAVWLPLRKLLHRARKHRDAELALPARRPDRCRGPRPPPRRRDPPSIFAAPSAAADSRGCDSPSSRARVVVRRRTGWRRLVGLPLTPPTPDPPPLPGWGQPPADVSDSSSSRRTQQ